MPYFDETSVKKWSFIKGYNDYQKNHTEKELCHLLHIIKNDLRLLEKGNDPAKAAKASLYLKTWRSLVKDLPQEVEAVPNSTSNSAGQMIKKETKVTNVELNINGGQYNSLNGYDTHYKNKENKTEEIIGSKRSNDVLLSFDDSLDNHKHRRYVVHYMVDVSRTWEPQTHWKIGTINITEKFQQFRSRSIFLSDAKQNLSDNRVLSLSNIFVITPYQLTSCLHRFEPNVYKAIVKNIKRKELWPDLPFPVRTWCGMIDQLISRNDRLPVRKLYALVRNFGDASDTAFEEEDYDDEDQETKEKEDDDNNTHVNNEEIDDFMLTTNILYNLIGTFQNWMSDCFFESTFIAQHVSPFIQPIFQRISVHVRLGETHINGKADSLLADCVGSYQAATGDKFDVLTCEVKPCKKTSISQVQSDFVKLGKEMKEMLDALLDYGVKSPLVTGILIEGKNMTTYTMRLTEQGCYILYEHGMFSLLESPQDVHRVPVILEHLIQLANLLKDTTRKISECSLSNEPSQAEVNWKQPSAGTPIRTNEER